MPSFSMLASPATFSLTFLSSGVLDGALLPPVPPPEDEDDGDVGERCSLSFTVRIN